jgi:hypothetical protein
VYKRVIEGNQVGRGFGESFVGAAFFCSVAAPMFELSAKSILAPIQTIQPRGISYSATHSKRSFDRVHFLVLGKLYLERGYYYYD